MHWYSLFLLLMMSATAAAEDSLVVSMKGQLSEVEITGFEAPLHQAPEVLDGIILAGKQTSIIDLSASDANLVQNLSRQVFSRTPGVFIWESDGSGVQTGVSIRGLNPNRSWELNVRQNGYDIAADPFGYPEAYYAPPLEAVESIRLVRGSSSLQFGPQFGGLLDYRMKSGDSTKLISLESQQSIGSYGLFSTYNAIGGQVGGFNYIASYHHRSAEGWRQNSSYRTDHFYTRLAYRPSTVFEAALEFTLLRNCLQQPGGIADSSLMNNSTASFRPRNWLETPWNTIALLLKWSPSDKWEVNLTVSSNIADRNSIGFVSPINMIDSIDRLTGQYSNRQLDKDNYRTCMSELRTSYHYEFHGRSHQLNMGIRYHDGAVLRLQKGVGSNGVGSDFDLNDESEGFANDLHYSTQNRSAFVENMFHIGNKIALVPGMRFESLISSASGRVGFEKSSGSVQVDECLRRNVLLGGLGVDWNPLNELTFHANVTSAYRPMTYSQLTPASSGDIVDPDLKDAYGNTIEFGLRGRVGDWLKFDLNLFRMFYGNRVGSLTMQRSDNSIYRLQTNLGNSLHHGMELYGELFPFVNAGKGFQSVSYFMSMSLLDARYSDYAFTKDVNGEIRQFSLDGNRVEYAPGLIIRSGLSWEYEGLSLVIQGAHTGKVYSDANNTVAPTPNYESGLIPAYQVFDFSSRWNFRKSYSIGFSISNIFDERYATRRASGYPGRGLMPNEARTLLLTLGLKI